MTDVLPRLERIFIELMTREQMPPQDRTRLSCASWDSLMQLNVILAIEQEFQVTFSDADAIDLTSFHAARQLIESKLNTQPETDGHQLPV